MAVETILGTVDPSLLGDNVEEVLRTVGVAGACVYLGNYTMLQLKVLSGDSILFTAINMAAAAMVLAGLTVDFNPGAAIIQIAWILLGTLGISITVIRRGRSRSAVIAPTAPPVGRTTVALEATPEAPMARAGART